MVWENKPSFYLNQVSNFHVSDTHCRIKNLISKHRIINLFHFLFQVIWLIFQGKAEKKSSIFWGENKIRIVSFDKLKELTNLNFADQANQEFKFWTKIISRKSLTAVLMTMQRKRKKTCKMIKSSDLKVVVVVVVVYDAFVVVASVIGVVATV